jgi:3-dehydroquinate synthase
MDGTKRCAEREIVRFVDLSEIRTLVDASKTILITDPAIYELYGKQLETLPVLLVPQGEAAKSWNVLLSLFDGFISKAVDRSWTVLALGGGSVSDIAGLAAHLWMRGIGVISVPTTLLAMTDAALGGKNGIDYHGYKNAIGSFQRPKMLLCDVETLRSLPDEQFKSGMAEVIKHGILDGEEYFSFLERCLTSSNQGFNHRTAPRAILETMIRESQRIKLDIVEEDPEEHGLRRLLNLGHTFGHGLELLKGLPHGYAVSLGIRIACAFSMRNGTMNDADSIRIEKLLSGFGLPTSLDFLSDTGVRESILKTLFMDKKRVGTTMNLVVPHTIGQVRVEKIPVADLQKFFLTEYSKDGL